MFKKFVDKGGFKKKKEYSYSSDGFDFPDDDYEESDCEEDEMDENVSSHKRKNVYSPGRTSYMLESEISSSCYPYAGRCSVSITGSAGFEVHVWCEREDEYRVTRIIESEYSDEPIDKIVVHYTDRDDISVHRL